METKNIILIALAIVTVPWLVWNMCISPLIDGFRDDDGHAQFQGIVFALLFLGLAFCFLMEWLEQ